MMALYFPYEEFTLNYGKMPESIEGRGIYDSFFSNAEVFKQVLAV